MRAAAVFAVLALTGCSLGGGDEEEGATAKADFVVNLDDGSTLAAEDDLGTVGLTSRDRKTVVTIEVANPGKGRRQAEIRRGNCESIDAGITYMLGPVVDGKSETVVDTPLRVLRRGGYLVMVHDVPAEARIDGICGDLYRSQPPSAAPTFD
jgi:hypothetical protein